MKYLNCAMLLSTCLAFKAAAEPSGALQQKPADQSTYLLIYDTDASPYAGGEDLLFAQRFLEWIEDLLPPKKNSIGSKDPRARLFRLAEQCCVWLPLNYEAFLIQHEIFGHGYRIRDLGSNRAQVTRYKLNTPPPYGPGGGATYFDYSYKVSSMELSSIASAGVEATAILANLTKFKWLDIKTIDARQTLLYLFSQHDLSNYISSTCLLSDEEIFSSTGHDIQDYLFLLNLTYPDSHLSYSRLRSLAWINLADPFTFYSIASWFHYISTGQDMQIPMIPIGKAGYLPGARLGLTPFGPEVFFENYVSLNHRFFYGYIKGGSYAGNSYIGAGCFCPAIAKVNNWMLGARIDLWRQPQILFSPGFHESLESNESVPRVPLYSASRLSQMQLGAAGSVVFSKHWKSHLGCEVELGIKSQGFLPGNSLWTSPIVRGGFTAQF